ncbi:hypothetical protein BaRGS_00019071 [Batillaria attramentaria]|uniref:Uncharacterized protein n=1 Tax=Batillaria attramentaria TaxID=370345 RepID=A0ABD0KRE0_9CAEN
MGKVSDVHRVNESAIHQVVWTNTDVEHPVLLVQDGLRHLLWIGSWRESRKAAIFLPQAVNTPFNSPNSNARHESLTCIIEKPCGGRAAIDVFISDIDHTPRVPRADKDAEYPPTPSSDCSGNLTRWRPLGSLCRLADLSYMLAKFITLDKGDHSHSPSTWRRLGNWEGQDLGGASCHAHQNRVPAQGIE